MLTLFIVILYSIFAIIVAYFSTQNTSVIILHIFSYTFKNIPTYLVILCSVLCGLIFSGIVLAFKMISLSLQLHEKENLLKEIKKKNAEIVKEMHQLEIENTQLKTKYDVVDTDEKSLT